MGYNGLKGKDSISQEDCGIKAIPPNYVLSITDNTFTEESGETYKISPPDLSQYTTSKTILNST